MQKEQTKTQRRSGSAKTTAITDMGDGTHQIAIPALGWFTSSNVDDLKRILRDNGYAYYFRNKPEEN